MIHNVARGVQSFTSNAFLVASDDRRVLVDTGANFDVVEHLRNDVPDLDAVYLTHTHPDHVGNVDDVREAFDVETWGYDTDHPAVDNPVADEETVRIGAHEYTALFTPGHAPDHLCFYSPTARVLFAGDLVFQNGGFGRTDLAGGDREQLGSSIDRLLATVDEDLEELHVGHGPSVVDRPFDDIELARRAARMG